MTRVPAAAGVGTSRRVVRAVGALVLVALVVLVLVAVAPFALRELRDWLAASADAPGAEGYVDGLPISFLVRNDAWEKETFGVVRAECASSADDISGCEPTT